MLDPSYINGRPPSSEDLDHVMTIRILFPEETIVHDANSDALISASSTTPAPPTTTVSVTTKTTMKIDDEESKEENGRGRRRRKNMVGRKRK